MRDQVSSEAYVGQERSELGAACIGDADARSEERCDFGGHGGAAGTGVVDGNRVDHVEKRPAGTGLDGCSLLAASPGCTTKHPGQPFEQMGTDNEL